MDIALVAGGLIGLQDSASAHGGQYRGPGDLLGTMQAGHAAQRFPSSPRFTRVLAEETALSLRNYCGWLIGDWTDMPRIVADFRGNSAAVSPVLPSSVLGCESPVSPLDELGLEQASRLEAKR